MRARAPTAVHALRGQSPAFSPQGTRLALIHRSDVLYTLYHTTHIAVRIYDVRTGALVATVPQTRRVGDLAWSRDGTQIIVLGCVSAGKYICQTVDAKSGVAGADRACIMLPEASSPPSPLYTQDFGTVAQLSPFGEFLTVVLEHSNEMHIFSTHSGASILPCRRIFFDDRLQQAAFTWAYDESCLACTPHLQSPHAFQLELLRPGTQERTVWYLESSSPVQPVIFSADGLWLAGRRPASMGVWRVGRRTASIWVRGATSACFSADSRLAIFAFLQEMSVVGHSLLEVWDVHRGVRVSQQSTMRQVDRIIGQMPYQGLVYFVRNDKLMAWHASGRSIAHIVAQQFLVSDVLGMGNRQDSSCAGSGIWNMTGDAFWVSLGNEVRVVVFAPVASC